ncbi:aminoacyl-tRNA deacylase [Vineibacter terrae]|uniref:aminoacyl-tRNA deacylase n=1 Tax=Vineibacter terrae TaxID=2586908 RepID=UPI001C499066|nr:YbaK/EbsC family protein [Vineibacter terrae]
MHVDFDVVQHAATRSASRTAEASHVPGGKIAKAVLLRDTEGYTLAVLPASHHVGFPGITAVLGCDARLATEQEIDLIFDDCAHGAVPAIGAAYGLDVVVDERLLDLDEVYFEGGDHTTLVRVSADDFGKLMAGARRARFAERG